MFIDSVDETVVFNGAPVSEAFQVKFINVTHRVGKTGDKFDVLVVQSMLKFLFIESPSLRRVNPVKGEITVDGKPSRQTTLLISAFQKHVLKRPNPEGFINRAIGTSAQKKKFTIYRLNFECELILQPIGMNIFDLILKILPLVAPELL